LLFGLVAFPYYAARGLEGAHDIRRWVRLCAVLALVTGVLEFLAMSGNMGDSWHSTFDPQIWAAAVTDTAFGHWWMVHLGLAVVVVVLCMKLRSGKSLRLLWASGGLLASIALTGHAAIPGGRLGMLHQLADALHLLGAGWWAGGLLALAMVARSLGDQLTVVLERFSRIGYVVVALVIFSGAVNSVMLVTHLSALVNSLYGRVLLIKIALVGMMGLLALSNRFQITPSLAVGSDLPRWTARLHRQVTLEFIAALLVLAIVGALGAMQPP
jgi:putative copper resistance protein D